LKGKNPKGVKASQNNNYGGVGISLQDYVKASCKHDYRPKAKKVVTSQG